MKTLYFLSCRDIKMTIMMSYFQIRDDVINFLNFTRLLPIEYSYQVSASSDLNQKMFWKICIFYHVFSQAFLPLIGYHGNSEWPILKLLILKDDLYIGLKITKFREDWLNRFWDIQQKPSWAILSPPLPPPLQSK